MNSINYNTIEKYLDNLPIDKKQSLQIIKDIINLTVPKCKERIAYKICVFSINKDLVGFASQKNYLSFYTMSQTLIKKMKKELQKYDVSGITIHFTPQKQVLKIINKKDMKSKIKKNYKPVKINFLL